MLNLNKHNTVCFEKGQSKTKQSSPIMYNDIRICFIINGQAIWNIENKEYQVKSGDIILLNDCQRRYFKEQSYDFHFVVIILERQAFFNTRHLSLWFDLAKENRFILKDNELFSILEKAQNEYREKRKDYFKLISVYLTEFCIKAKRKFNPTTKSLSPKMDRQMLETLNYINDNLENEITLADLSCRVNLSESAFSRLFQKYNNISFKRYLMTKRIEKAVILLQSTDKKVIDISLECGFSSISGFYNAFNIITGTTPTKFTEII